MRRQTSRYQTSFGFLVERGSVWMSIVPVAWWRQYTHPRQKFDLELPQPPQWEQQSLDNPDQRAQIESGRGVT